LTDHHIYSKYDADIKRQKRLESFGLRFLRFSEKDVMQNIDGVMTTIGSWIEEHTPPFGHPSREGKE